MINMHRSDPGAKVGNKQNLVILAPWFSPLDHLISDMTKRAQRHRVTGQRCVKNQQQNQNQNLGLLSLAFYTVWKTVVTKQIFRQNSGFKMLFICLKFPNEYLCAAIQNSYVDISEPNRININKNLDTPIFIPIIT